MRRLGIEDYGIFNTIAGVVTIASFLTGVLSLSVQRFFSFYIGKNDIQKQTEIYSSCINIIALLSVLIIFIFETVGLWFVNTQLVLPTIRMTAVIWLYQFTIFTFIFSLFQIPYTAAIFAQENIGVYAIVSTIECLLRLGSAALIGKFMIDNLSFYGMEKHTIKNVITTKPLTVNYIKSYFLFLVGHYLAMLLISECSKEILSC